MNKLIVIVNPKSGTDLSNIHKDAKEAQPNASEVRQISDRAWLIDLHISLSFFAALLNSAHKRDCEFFVYEVADIIHDRIALSGQG